MHVFYTVLAASPPALCNDRVASCTGTAIALYSTVRYSASAHLPQQQQRDVIGTPCRHCW